MFNRPDCQFDAALRHIDSPNREVQSHAEEILSASPKPEHIAALRERRHRRWATPDSENFAAKHADLRRPKPARTPFPIFSVMIFAAMLILASGIGAVIALSLASHVGERAITTVEQSALPAFREWDGGL